MRTWLINWWDWLRTNFWFVPSLMVAAAILLSSGMLWLDRLGGAAWAPSLGLSRSRGPEGARALLSTVAGSMMTIASLTFSITIVTLQLASSQFGPRLLRNFVRDRGNQVVLGTFIATFTYCLLVLRTVNGTEQHEFVPHLSVFAAVLLTLASLGVLIYFIHHTAVSIQAESVVASVGRDLCGALDTLFPSSLGQERAEGRGRPGPGATLRACEGPGVTVPAGWSGYVQAINGDQLLRLATDHDLVLRVERRPGQFAMAGSALARAWTGRRLDEPILGQVAAAFYLGDRRTLTQDATFAIDQLVEVAVRSLSPGINDSFTAVACIDQLGSALAHLAGRRTPSPHRLDESGLVRVIAEATTKAGLADAAFGPLRQAARGNVAVALRLLEVLAQVAGFAREPEFREALRQHAGLVHREGLESLPSARDRAELDTRHRQLFERDALSPIPNAVHPTPS